MATNAGQWAMVLATSAAIGCGCSGDDDQKACDDATAELIALCGTDKDCSNSIPRALTVAQQERAAELNAQVAKYCN